MSAKSSTINKWSPYLYFNILSHLGEWYSGACIRDKHVAVTGATTPRAATGILSDFGYHSKLAVRGSLKQFSHVDIPPRK